MRMTATRRKRPFSWHSTILASTVVSISLSVAPRGDAAETAAAPTRSIEIPSVAYITLMLARDPTVQAELKLQARQIDELSAAIAEVDQPLWVLRDVPISKSATALDGLLARFQKQLNRILTGEQRDRLNEIILQARGYKALTSPDVSQRLGLSEKQIEQLEQALSQVKSEGTTLPKRIVRLLSAQQQTELSVMAGSPFDLDRVRRIQCAAPELRDVSAWVNSPPLTLAGLRGKVVVVHFWAFGCINCVHNLPHYQAWYERFPESKLTIIGIHTPETEPERSVENLRSNVAERGIAYPVAVDAAAANWNAWGNHVWPAVYLIDKRGYVRAYWYGELNWQGARGEEAMRKKIQELLTEPVDRWASSGGTR